MIRLKDLLFEQTKTVVKKTPTQAVAKPLQPNKVMEPQHITRGLEIANKLKQRGFTDEQAAAITGNFWAESEFNPAVSGMGGAKGLMQWTGNRKANLINYAKKQGKAWTDEDIQLDFLKHELSDPWEKRQFDSGMAGQDVAAKAKGFYSKSERANAPDSIVDRIHGAQEIYKNLVNPAASTNQLTNPTNTTTNSTTPATTTTETPATTTAPTTNQKTK